MACKVIFCTAVHVLLLCLLRTFLAGPRSKYKDHVWAVFQEEGTFSLAHHDEWLSPNSFGERAELLPGAPWGAHWSLYLERMITRRRTTLLSKLKECFFVYVAAEKNAQPILRNEEEGVHHTRCCNAVLHDKIRMKAIMTSTTPNEPGLHLAPSAGTSLLTDTLLLGLPREL